MKIGSASGRGSDILLLVGVALAPFVDRSRVVASDCHLVPFLQN
jgi:hypothetical protein